MNQEAFDLSQATGTAVGGPCDLVVRDVVALTDVPSGTVRRGASIAVNDGRIVAIGATAEISQVWKARQVIEGGGGYAMPGLIDAHTHPTYLVGFGTGWSPSPLPSPFAHGGDVDSLVSGYAGALARDVPERLAEAVADLAVATAAIEGQTGLVDGGGMDPIALANASTRFGLRIRVAATGSDLRGHGEPFARLRDADRVLDGLAEQLACLTSVDVPRAVSGFWPMMCSDELLDGMAELVREHDAAFVTHVGMVANEDEASRRWFGSSGVERLAERGLVNERFVALHGGHLGDSDLAVLAAENATLAHTPAQNAMFGKGIAARRTIERARAAGVQLALGTDTVPERTASMVDAIRAALMLARDAAGDEDVLADTDALVMATTGGAAGLGVERLGALRVGWHADLAVWRRTQALADHPLRTLIAAQPRDVSAVVAGGRVVVEQGELVDDEIEELRRRARTAYDAWVGAGP